MYMDKHMFLGANTPDGFVHYFDKLTEMYNLKKLYILKGTPGCGKSTLMKKFANAFNDEQRYGARTFFYCSADPNSLDGIVLEDLGVAIVDGTAPHEISNGELVFLADIGPYDPKIQKLCDKKGEHYRRAFRELAHARILHKQLERHYTSKVDFESVNALCSKLITSTKLEAGVISRKSHLENSTK